MKDNQVKNGHFIVRLAGFNIGGVPLYIIAFAGGWRTS